MCTQGEIRKFPPDYSIKQWCCSTFHHESKLKVERQELKNKVAKMHSIMTMNHIGTAYMQKHCLAYFHCTHRQLN